MLILQMYVALNMSNLSFKEKIDLLDKYPISCLFDTSVIDELSIYSYRKFFDFKDYLLDCAYDEIKLAEKLGIVITYIGSDDYPAILYDSIYRPIVLYIKGNSIETLNHFNLVGIVGPRKASSSGLDIGYNFAYNLSKMDMPIISGLALGVDRYAHIGAIEASGKTIAVLGCGINKYYPTCNMNLQNDICNNGCIISELPINMPPMKYNFPIRNRIISGLSSCLFIPEINYKSGALHTIKYSIELGSKIYVYDTPNNKEVLSQYNISENINYINSYEEIIDSDFNSTNNNNLYNNLNDIQKDVYDSLSYDKYTSLDKLSCVLNLPVNEIIEVLIYLKTNNYCFEENGFYIKRNSHT